MSYGIESVGVTFNDLRPINKYLAIITLKGSRKNLGCFPCLLDAQICYDNFVLKLRGENYPKFYRMNFPPQKEGIDLSKYRSIELSQNEHAIVDIKNYDRLNQHKWHVHIDPKNGVKYAVRNETVGEKQITIKMHREIMNVTDSKMQVDHWNHDGLLDIEENLRVCTPSQNQGNQLIQINNKTGLRGVSYKTKNKCYVAQLCTGDTKSYLGCFKNKVDAGKAYDKAAYARWGIHANVNYKGDYPDTISPI